MWGPGMPAVLLRRAVGPSWGYHRGGQVNETDRCRYSYICLAIVTYAFKSFEANSDWLGIRTCLLVGVLPHGVPADDEGHHGEVLGEVKTGVGLGLWWPAAGAELPGAAAAAGFIAPQPGGELGPGCGLRLLALRTAQYSSLF